MVIHWKEQEMSRFYRTRPVAVVGGKEATCNRDQSLCNDVCGELVFVSFGRWHQITAERSPRNDGMYLTGCSAHRCSVLWEPLCIMFLVLPDLYLALFSNEEQTNLSSRLLTWASIWMQSCFATYCGNLHYDTVLPGRWVPTFEETYASIFRVEDVVF
jgi:hypothetical protein